MYTIQAITDSHVINDGINASRAQSPASLRSQPFEFPSFDNAITLSPSQVVKGQSCMKKLAFQRAGIKPVATSVNMLFGKAIHQCIEEYLHQAIDDTELSSYFEDVFFNLLGNQSCVSYSATQTDEKLDLMGGKLTSSFPDFFRACYIRPLFLELPLAVRLHDDIVVRMVIDFVGRATRDLYDQKGRLIANYGDTVIVDWKTPATPSKYAFVLKSLQLSWYWLALTAYSTHLNIPAPKLVGYGEGIKKTDAYWEPIRWVSRSQDVLQDAIRSTEQIANNIKADNYIGHSQMAFDSPCQSMMGPCDVLEPCIFGAPVRQTNPGKLDTVQLLNLIDAKEGFDVRYCS